MEQTLPKEFEMLEPLVAVWALPTQNERQRRRIASTVGELRELYDSMQPRLPAILAYLDKFPLGDIPPDAARLMSLALSLAEIAPHIELYGGDHNVPHSFDEARFVAEHGELQY